MRATDTCARVGLDKLMIILAGATREGAGMFSAKLGKLLKERGLLAGGPSPDFCVAISVGLAEAGPDSRVDDLLGVAGSKRI